MTHPYLCPVCTKRERRPNAMTCEHCPATITRNLREIRDLYPLLAAATTPGQGTAGPHVSGSREAPVPVLLHVVDLAAPADDRTVSDPYGDQTGAVSIASVLDGWVSDWIDHRRKGEHQPLPTVPELARWLLVRVDDACDTHPAVDEFAREVFGLVCAVRVALQISRRPESLHTPCPTCEMLSLKRAPGADHVECRNCGRLWTEDEYARLAVVAASEAKGEAA